MAQVTETFDLDMVPGGVPLIVNVSQNDLGWKALKFVLLNRYQFMAIPNGTVALINGKKADGKGFSYPMIVNASDHSVQIDVQDQMTAVAGVTLCEVSLQNGSSVLGSANFIMRVEENPLNNAVISDSDLNAVTEAVSKIGEALSAADTATRKASEAASSAGRSANSAQSAGNSASQAAFSAQSAGNSATASKNSADASAKSAKSASDSASNASESASEAKTSETNANTSASNASKSETAAKTSADNAAKSAQSAGNSASDASSSATAAKNSETNSKSSETAAAESAKAAAESVTTAASIAGVGEFSYYIDENTGLRMRFKKGGLTS